MAVKDRPGLVRLQAQPTHVRRRQNAVQEFLRTSRPVMKVKPTKPTQPIQPIQRGLFDGE